jgi:phosphoglycolate phosphatase-like HAD superfamily hydrolase
MLLLFDIDGTLLIRAAGAHREAIHEALRVVHGVDASERSGLQPAGRPDGEIARNLLVQAGVAARQIDERADDLRIAACEAYGRLCPGDLSANVAAGMSDLLERLAVRDDAVLALVTGNFEPIARLKLRRAGIEHYFATGQGGFGSDHEDRTMLPEIARQRAGAEDGEPWPTRRTVVIGDTPRDIACARADGVRVAAIATGPYEPSALQAADAVARDTRELDAILQRWLS